MYQRIGWGFLATLAATALCATACDSGLRKGSSNDISVDKDEVVFKRPVQGRDDSDVEVVRIRSAGATALTVNNVYLESPMSECDLTVLGKTIYDDLGELDEVCSFLIVERNEVPKTMENGDFMEVKLVFHRNPELGPLTGDLPTGRLIIESDTTLPEDRTKYVSLGVEGETPKIQANPTVIAFPPDSAPGTPLEENIVIRNAGTGTLLVDDIQLRVTSDPAKDPSGNTIDEFVLLPQTELPWAVDESSTFTLTLQYTPADTVADSAQIIIKSNDAEFPSLVLTATSQPLQGLLLVDPLVADFTLENGDFDATVDFRFQNNGLKPVEVYDMVIRQPGMDYKVSTAGGGNTSFQLQPGGVAEGVAVYYHPADINAQTDGELFISTNADNAIPKPAELVDLVGDKVIRVPLVHNIANVPGTLALDPLSLDLTDTPAGETGEATLTLTNSGGAPVSITRIELSTEADEAAGMASDPEFKIAEGGGAVTLPPGESHEVLVQLTRSPADMAQHFGAIVIESDAEGSPHIVTLFADAPPESN